MPRTRQNTKTSAPVPEPLPEPVDIIDLTQDSPMNTALRLSRSRACQNANESPDDPDDIEPLILTNNPDGRLRKKKQKLSKPAVVINLDETINLEDTSNNMTNQKSVLPRSPNKQGLTCPICLDSLSNENVKAMTTPCGHVYCLECLKKVTSDKKKCSLCQRPITYSKCIRLHI